MFPDPFQDLPAMQFVGSTISNLQCEVDTVVVVFDVVVVDAAVLSIPDGESFSLGVAAAVQFVHIVGVLNFEFAKCHCCSE